MCFPPPFFFLLKSSVPDSIRPLQGTWSRTVSLRRIEESMCFVLKQQNIWMTCEYYFLMCVASEWQTTDPSQHMLQVSQYEAKLMSFFIIKKILCLLLPVSNFKKNHSIHPSINKHTTPHRRAQTKIQNLNCETEEMTLQDTFPQHVLLTVFISNGCSFVLSEKMSQEANGKHKSFDI